MAPCCFSCGRSSSPNTPLMLTCADCARLGIYKYRIDYAQILLEKDSLGKQIERATSSSQEAEANSTFADALNTTKIPVQSEKQSPARQWTIEETAAKIEESRERTRTIREQIKFLKEDIESKRAIHATRKKKLAQHRSDYETATYEVDSRRAKTLSKIENDVKKSNIFWNRTHATLAESRFYIAQELARDIAMLRRHEHRTRDGKVMYTYSIAGIEIVNLRGLSAADKDQVTASLTSISRLVCLVSYYFGVRLPAEICLPCPGQPLPTILSPATSYQAPHQGSQVKNLHPRSLSITKPIPQLLREDPVTSNSFLEGVSLLAWDIAWLARTQGIRQGTETWEEICDVGHNLYRLLIAPPPPLRSVTNHQPSSISASSRTPRDPTAEAQSRPRTRLRTASANDSALGCYSHGSAHSFLCSAKGTEFMGTWKFAGLARFVEKVKSALFSEVSSAEWELLDGQDWDHDNEGQMNSEHSEPEISSGGNLDQTVLV